MNHGPGRAVEEGGAGMLIRKTALAFAVAVSLVAAPAEALIRDAEMDAVLRDIADPIFRVAGFESGDIRVSVWNHPSVNAFATGDNRIVLFSGLIEAASTYPELAAVIAHETAHIANGHVSRRSEQLSESQTAASMISLLALLTAGAGSLDAGAAIGGLAATQRVAERSFLVYTRSQEVAADGQAVVYLQRVGLDPGALVSFLEVLERDQATWGQVDPYSLTHPAAEERIDNLRRSFKIGGAQALQGDPSLEYRFTRIRAKLAAFLSDPATVLGRISPDDLSEIATLRRAIALHRKGDGANALEEMNRLLSLVPGDPYYLELKGQILFENGRTTESVAAYRAAMDAAPEEGLISVGLGQALLATESADADREALEVLEAAVRRDELDARARYFLAQALGRAGDRPRANLMIAEERLIRGDIEGAAGFARRAAEEAETGSPTWFRAQDILAALGAPPVGETQ